MFLIYKIKSYGQGSVLVWACARGRSEDRAKDMVHWPTINLVPIAQPFGKSQLPFACSNDVAFS